MTLEQLIRLQRRRAERHAKAIHVLGHWPRSLRKVNLLMIRHGFRIKLDQVREMVDLGVPAHLVRDYARSRAAVFVVTNG